MRTRLLVIALTGALVGGCSSTRLAYNNADWYLAREIAKHVCPSAAQRKALKRAVKRFMRWHRRHELPRYARDLRRVARGLQQPVTRELLLDVYAILDGARERASRRAVGPLVAFGMALGGRQTGCLAVKLQQRRRERLDELGGSAEAYRGRALDKVVDNLEPWIGAPTAAQRRLLAGMIPSQRVARAVAAARHSKGLRLVAALGSSDLKKKRGWLSSWVTDPYALYSGKERALLRGREQRNKERLWPLVRTMTAEQRRRFASKLLDYARDFEALSRQ